MLIDEDDAQQIENLISELDYDLNELTGALDQIQDQFTELQKLFGE